MRFVFPLFPFFLFLPTIALAQGCPPGQYQIGGQGAVGCAPMQGNTVQQEPHPSGKWIKTWRAIASDGADNLGVSTGKLKKSEAEQEAIGNCQSTSNNKCYIIHSYKNQCAAVAEPSRLGRIERASSNGPSIEIASRDALSLCQKRNSGDDCKVIYKECSEPIFKKY
ncbi:DUF4189 domain-containing protein [Xanthomonas nasturtii]|uniref:DUF4189 domain-containing protein n=1 Tax=Xanthomonas nasturtii TaxID=1843581 RepID=UPI0020138841|nr:DUF4189 domain-containing protein [Xanthomonas nasturtii]MCL1526850.1 DUF4189 domain-containing protein [Xanthomonas nasturtii]MCL1536501.1 DUF4189 domain-containing protein [Xanthomonas nasturtii]MCL1544048.1 DUF4189 domain-containing protein [Xanthomonas nasturtii]